MGDMARASRDVEPIVLVFDVVEDPVVVGVGEVRGRWTGSSDNIISSRNPINEQLSLERGSSYSTNVQSSLERGSSYSTNDQ